MADRPSIKEILELARKGGPAKPGGAASPASAEPAAPAAALPEPVEAVTEESESEPEPMAAEPPAPAAPPLGRPLTLQEKLAAARAGGAPRPAPAAPKKPAAQPVTVAEASLAAEAAPAPAGVAPAAPAPAAPPLGRPLTLKEKLAAARGGAAPAAAAGAQPAAAKAAPGAPTAAKPAAAARALPPLDKITDPKDLAEAARQAGAKVKAAAAKAAPPAPAKPTKHAGKEKKSEVIPPKPSKDAVLAEAGTSDRRTFLVSVSAWIWIGWATFAAGMLALTAACGRFMFPNVLAEPPSTIKVGVPSNFEPESVSERWKTEWGFWVVRSTRYNGQDIIYAIQSVCTHLGCPPNWLGGEQKFKCPCHGSGFYISGVNFEGPAPRPLERFKVALADDGQILIDKSQKYQEEMGQWLDPDSFIPV